LTFLVSEIADLLKNDRVARATRRDARRLEKLSKRRVPRRAFEMPSLAPISLFAKPSCCDGQGGYAGLF
jgi:hypothetical protein